MSEDSLIPKRLGEYREREYWDRRYQRDGGTYDWLIKYEALRELLLPLLRPADRILNLGCGNSTLSEELYAEGVENIVNIDYSEPVITAMRQRTGHLPHMQWHTMDMRSLAFTTDSFDVVLDKGSLDAVWTDGGSVWEPSETVRSDIRQTVGEILRVLRPGGLFISISFGQPHFRKPLLLDERWHLSVTPIADTFYFLYLAKKHSSD